MKMNIRKAAAEDIDAVEKIYDRCHTAEEEGRQHTGWVRGVYPVRATAEAALERGDLFVLEDNGRILGSGIINNIQVDVYSLGNWKYAAADDQACVLHTFMISPESAGKGYGGKFLSFYEAYAKEHGYFELRLDTNEKNLKARAMYRKRGYTEVGIVPTKFNGIPDVHLVLLEKHIGK